MNTLTSIGKFSKYGGKEFFKSENGYLFTDHLGGPSAVKQLENFEAREDDVYVVSFPKTGTTWLQEIVFLIGSNLDFETAKKVPMMTRCPFMEMAISNPVDVSKMASPRHLKFHYSYSMLPQSLIDKKCKIICPIRNPKDTIVSYYHFSKAHELIGFTEDLEMFVDLFVNDEVLNGPFWKFMLEFWEIRHRENILLVGFEEMVEDLPSVIQRIAEFMGKDLSDDEIYKIAEFCSFDSMKQNFKMSENQNKTEFNKTFFRKGKVGDWRNYFTQEMNQKVDDYLVKHFSNSDINFIYE